MRGRRGFTLVELLIVVSILAMLVAMLLPTVSGARAMAHKALCQGNLHAYGVAVAQYVGAYRTYPHLGSETMEEFPWPKMYAVLEMTGVPGIHKVKGRVCYHQWLPDQVWSKALCPSMNARDIWAFAAAGSPPVEKVDLHRGAIGYQWNVCLRGPSSGAGGRWPASLTNVMTPDLDDTMWVDYWLDLPGQSYYCQAVHPSEIDNPSIVAEAWDSYDLDSVDRNATWANLPVGYSRENAMPGCPVGPQAQMTNGWACLPRDRHKIGNGSPNILYADGSVRSDATKRLTLNDVGSGNWPSNKTPYEPAFISWDDYDAKYGTMHHIIPKKSLP